MTSPLRLKDSIDQKSGVFRLPDSTLFEHPGFSVTVCHLEAFLVCSVSDGNFCVQNQVDASFDRISLLLVLRDHSASTLNYSACPASEWKSFMFLVEGEKDYVMRFQLEFVFMHITFRFLQ